MEGLELSRQGATLVAVIDRGEGNLFTSAMTAALSDEVARAGLDDELRFLRLRASGSAFCLGRDAEGSTPDELRRVGARIAQLNQTLRETPLIVICEVAGDAAGFGVGLVASADVAIASERAQFWFPELERGLPPAVVLSWLAKLMPRKQAFELVATGRRVAAAEALSRGLVTQVVPVDGVASAAEGWLERLSPIRAAALRDSKELLARAEVMDERDVTRTAADALALGALRLRDPAKGAGG